MNPESMIRNAGHDEIGRDHQALVALLERVKRVCGCAAASAPDSCRGCPAERHALCRSSLQDLTHGLMVFMLDHFRHEDELMMMLPDMPDAKVHCARHRREHVGFSTRYNDIVAKSDAGNVVSCMRKMELFIIEWIRRHALEYDAVIVSLLDVGKSA